MLKNIQKSCIALGMGLVATAAANAETVKIAYPNWADAIALSNLAKAVLEEEMDVKVEMTLADPGAVYAAVASGNQDVFVNAWLPHTHAPYWEEYSDQLVNLGPNFAYGVTGLVVPSYVPIDSIEELPQIRDRLDGKIIGIDTGAGIFRNTNKAIEEYELDFEQVASSGPAMTAALKDAIDSEEYVVVTGWKPHWKFGRFDLKILNDPKSVYPIDSVRTVVRKGFPEDHPEVTQFLINFAIHEEQLLDLMIKIDEKDADPYEVAVEWVRGNAALVDSWIPRD